MLREVGDKVQLGEGLGKAPKCIDGIRTDILNKITDIRNNMAFVVVNSIPSTKTELDLFIYSAPYSNCSEKRILEWNSSNEPCI